MTLYLVLVIAALEALCFQTFGHAAPIIQIKDETKISVESFGPTETGFWHLRGALLIGDGSPSKGVSRLNYKISGQKPVVLTTDDEGIFTADLPKSTPFPIRLRFEGGDLLGASSALVERPAHDPAHSAETKGERQSLLWTRRAFWVSFAILAIFLVAQALRRRWPTRLGTTQARAKPAPKRRHTPRPAGIRVEDKNMSNLPMSSSAIGGRIVESRQGRPVVNAQVALLLEGEANLIYCQSDSAGHFSFPEFGEARARVEVSHPHHVTQSTRLSGGSAPRDLEVVLLPIREHIFELYRQVAEPLMPKTRSWGQWTPAQILKRAQGLHTSATFETLTHFVESVYFGPEDADAATLDSFQRVLASARSLKSPLE